MMVQKRLENPSFFKILKLSFFSENEIFSSPSIINQGEARMRQNWTNR